MTAVEALRILNRVWGMGAILSSAEARALTLVQQPYESAMATCARVAGVDITGVQPFDLASVRYLCARREIELARAALG